MSGQPAVQFTLTFTNKSSSPVSIDSNTVTVTDANNAWSEDSPDNGDDAPATGTVAVGQSVTGKYVFVVPIPERGQHGIPIVIDISVTGSTSPQPIMATDP